MSEPFLAEIKIIGFTFAPRGWAYCDGQILQIQQNQSLYSLLGTTYGGDGRNTFALPDLRGRVPIHPDDSISLGGKGGEAAVTLTTATMPSHNHLPLNATNTDGSSQQPAGNLLARTVSLQYEANATNAGPNIQAGTVSFVGNGNAHNNMMPYTTLGFIIALQGVFPSRN